MYELQSLQMANLWLAALSWGRLVDVTLKGRTVLGSVMLVGGRCLSRSETQPVSGKDQKQSHITELWAGLGFGSPNYIWKWGQKQEDGLNTQIAKSYTPVSTATSCSRTTSLPTLAGGARCTPVPPLNYCYQQFTFPRHLFYFSTCQRLLKTSVCLHSDKPSVFSDVSLFLDRPSLKPKPIFFMLQKVEVLKTVRWWQELKSYSAEALTSC